MKKVVICSLLLTIVLSSFVVAGSESVTKFIIGERIEGIGDYISVGNFWDDYIIYVIGFFVLLIGLFIFKMKKFTKIFPKEKLKKRS